MTVPLSVGNAACVSACDLMTPRRTAMQPGVVPRAIHLGAVPPGAWVSLAIHRSGALRLGLARPGAWLQVDGGVYGFLVPGAGTVLPPEVQVAVRSDNGHVDQAAVHGDGRVA